jgi:lysyl-tRNA synthetase class 1
LTQTIPPEVVRYMIFRVKPMRHIAFDPGLPLLNLVDEYDDVTAHNRDQRATELARMEGLPPLGISFKHLVNLVQITEGDVDKISAILQRHHLPVPERQVLRGRVAYAQYWLQHFSPAEMRLRLQKALPAQVANLTPAQRQALGYWRSVCSRPWTVIPSMPWSTPWLKNWSFLPRHSLKPSTSRCSISHAVHAWAGF